MPAYPTFNQSFNSEAGEDGTNLVAAYVVLRPGMDADNGIAEALKSHALASLPRFKRPKRVYFLDQLPRTSTGKIQRFKLRRRDLLS